MSSPVSIKNVRFVLLYKFLNFTNILRLGVILYTLQSGSKFLKGLGSFPSYFEQL